MGDMPTIEEILDGVSGAGYISDVESKIDSLMQKLKDGDRAITDEGSGGGYGSPPWASTNYLKERLMALIQTDPDGFSPPITKLSQAALRLGADQIADKAYEQVSPDSTAGETVSYYVAKVKSVVGGSGTPADPGWTGDSADAFEDKFAKYYVGPGETVVDQRWLMNSMQLIMEAHRAVYVRTRDDIKSLVEAADNATGLADDSSPGGSANFLLTLGAAVTGVVVAGATAGAGAALWPVIAASFSGGASILGAVPEEQAQPFDLKVCCTFDLFFSIQEAVGDLEKKQQDMIGKVQTALTNFNDKLGEAGTLKELKGPEVVDANGKTPIVYDEHGNGHIEDDYLDDFDPPAS